jgi:hypothetical protein
MKQPVKLWLCGDVSDWVPDGVNGALWGKVMDFAHSKFSRKRIGDTNFRMRFLLVPLCTLLTVLCCSGCWRLDNNNGTSVVRTRLVDGPWVNCPPLRGMPRCFYIYGLALCECDGCGASVA